MKTLRDHYEQGVADGLEKFATRAALKRIRYLMRQGNIEEASRIAKLPGALPSPQLQSVRPTPESKRRLWDEREYFGSEIHPFGVGQEHGASLVADPIHGIVTRKIRHDNAVTPASMDSRVSTLQNAAAPYTTRRLSNVRHPRTGARISFHEYAPGTSAKTLLNKNKKSPDEAAAIIRATDHLKRRVSDIAQERGMIAGDLTPHNMVLQKTPQGYQGKVIDMTARPIGQADPTLPSKSAPAYGDVMRKAFGEARKSPTEAAYARETQEAIAKASRKQRASEQADSRSGPTKPAATPPARGKGTMLL